MSKLPACLPAGSCCALVSRDKRRSARIPVLFHVPIVEWEYMLAATIGDLKPYARHMRAKSMGTDPIYSGTYFRKELIYGLRTAFTVSNMIRSPINKGQKRNPYEK